jgi:hypothetical protein
VIDRTERDKLAESYQWHLYTQQAQNWKYPFVIWCDEGSWEGRGVHASIITYASRWEMDNLPPPEQLATFLDEFMFRLLCEPQDPVINSWAWYEDLETNPTEWEDIIRARTGILIMRMPWQFESSERGIKVRGRFGVVKYSDLGGLDGKTLAR